MNDIKLGAEVRFNYYGEYGRVMASGRIRGTDGTMVKIDVDPKFKNLPEQVTIAKSLVFEEETDNLNITRR